MEQEELKIAVKPEVEKLQQTKRIYRGAQDIISKLDGVLRHKQPYRSVFEWDAVELRMKLKDLCERLMFLQPVDYGRKAEELLWRKVYYDVISVVRKNKKHVRPGSSLECAYHTHLLAATGFYHHLLLRLQQQYKLSLCGIVDFVDAGDHWTAKGPLPPPGSKRAKARDWAEKACHRCLIYLGDLARYRQDFDGYRSRLQAERFYHQALLLNPAMGMPHNQLGTLAGNRHQGLDCAYHYLRCWLSEIPFDGAIANLEKTLEQNSKRYQELPRQANRDLPPDLQRPRDLKHFLIKFLYLQELLQPGAWPAQDQLASLCQIVVHDFSLCMYHTLTQRRGSLRPGKAGVNSLPRGADPPRESAMSDDLVFKLFVMTMMTIYKLQKADRKWVSAAIVFMLAMFTHLLTHVNERLQSALYEAQHPRRVREDEEDSSEESSSQTDESGNEQHSIAGTLTPTHSQEVESSGTCSDGTVKHLPQKDKQRKALNRRRRRRRPLRDGQTESDDSDLSEGALSASDGSDVSSSDGEGSSEGGLLALSDSDYLMDSQDQEEDQTPEKGREKKADMDDASVKAVDDSKKEQPSHADKVKEWSTTSPVSLAQNLRDMSSRLLAPSPTGFLKRTIRLAPSFDAYIKERAETVKDGGSDEGTGEASKTEEKTGDEAASEADTSREDAESKPCPLDLHIKVLNEERLLCTVKLITDWLRGNSDVITTTAENTQMLWSKLALLLNQLPQVEDFCSEEWCKSSEALEAITGSLQEAPGVWKQILPLTEDIAVMKLPPLTDSQKAMAFDLHMTHDLTEQDETLLRVLCLRQFGHFLTTVKDLSFVHDDKHKAFHVPSSEDVVDLQDASTESEEMETKPAEKEERRTQMMKDLAVRWLEHEIQQLEGQVQDGAANTQFSPYLVPDANALMNHLGLIQLLADSERFIIVIPYSVVGHLDHFKKKHFEAREASRFLEQILKKGNRHIRVQRQHEVLQLDKDKKPKDKDKSIKTLYHIIECALYFSQRSALQGNDSHDMVTVLTDYRPGQLAASPLAMAAVEMAQGRGLRVENASEFYHSWKNSVQS
ncbi:protein SMG5-like isoform X2 [Acanthaster planci]|uniref:Protein SMG5-like isoform X2 n=1 Tax=Acanthaster planci TaxID=133434 RepID=A0A8B7YSW8_ACAPL|nr:protein SMG5-like isoform X2 [Acanthaster planci]